MTNYAAGRRKEWAARKLLAKASQLTLRAAGSKGLVDLVAVYHAAVYLVQVKYCKRGATWRDANWRKLLTLAIPGNVYRVAYVYRRGCATPEVYSE